MTINWYKLNESGVVFNREDHTYTLDGRPLEGITKMISSMLFPDKYAAVSQSVLDKAADYGTSVHESIEMYYKTGIDDGSVELDNYRQMLDEHGLQYMAGEYIVTDGKHFASPIDAVLVDNAGRIWLDDHKTTSAVDVYYLAWQLNWYRIYFEKQNPSLKVYGLVCSWLRGEKAKMYDIRYLDDELIHQLEEQYLTQSVCTLDKEQLPVVVRDLADAIYKEECDIKTAQNLRDKLKETLLAEMKRYGCLNVKLDGKVTISYCEPSKRESIDSKKLKELYPEAYAACLKQSNVAESIRITLNK